MQPTAHLTVDDVLSKRAVAEPSRTGIAAYATSESYKSRHCSARAQSRSMSHHFTIECSNFGGSTLFKPAKGAFKHKLIPLGVGRPTVDFYPWDSLTFKENFTSPGASQADPEPVASNMSANTIVKRAGPFDMAHGLDYSDSIGHQPLLRFITEHVEIVHNPPYRDWNVCLTCGSTSAFEIALRMLCNRGDTVLTESHTYPGFISTTVLLGLQKLGVGMDDEGLAPEELSRILETWDDSKGRRPSVLYTIPSGQNPTGATQSMERKNAIYQIAEEFDLMIIEDDPYFFLRTLDNPRPAKSLHHPQSYGRSTAETYLSTLPPSFLSLDQSGRVLRLDSTSKILAPGLRAGWVTASKAVLEKFVAYQEVGPMAMAGPTQLMLWNLLDATWGHRDFVAWLEHLALQYRFRLDIMLKACDKYLPKDICRWTTPKNGMFLWIRLDALKHPMIRCQSNGIRNQEEVGSKFEEIEANLWTSACEHGVQVTKGSLFSVTRARPAEVSFRFTYAAADEAELEYGVKCFGDAVCEEFQLDQLDRSSLSQSFACDSNRLKYLDKAEPHKKRNEDSRTQFSLFSLDM